MKKLSLVFSMFLLLLLTVNCSDDDGAIECDCEAVTTIEYSDGRTEEISREKWNASTTCQDEFISMERTDFSDGSYMIGIYEIQCK